MREYLEKKLAELERQKIEIEAQIGAYRDMLARAQQERKRPRSVDGSRGRPISPTWQMMLNFLADTWPASATNDELVSFAAQRGVNLTRENLRSQLSLYTERGLLERAKTGVYRITEAGAREVGRVLPGAIPDGDRTVAAPSAVSAHESAADVPLSNDDEIKF